MRVRLGRVVPVGLLLLLLLAGCSDASPSTMQPQGAGARRIDNLWWLMLGLGTAVFLVVGGLIVASWVVRRRSLEVNRFVLVGGVLLPTLVLVVVGVETVRATNEIFENVADEADVIVEGEQFWWRVTYPEAGVETANEVHLPAGEPFTVEVRSDDVIHSFWLPELAGKVDMIPGQNNRTVLEVDEPGVYRGKCAEFCGVQHANMRFVAVVHEPDEFDAWLEARSEPPPEPSGLEAEGQQVFLEQPCAGCHRVEGTPAEGDVGPDLTDVGARRAIGAGLLENTTENLGDWVEDPDALKPGVLMPPVELSDEDLDALVAYLESLSP